MLDLPVFVFLYVYMRAICLVASFVSPCARASASNPTYSPVALTVAARWT